MKYLLNLADPFLPSPRNNLRQHVRGVGQDDLGLDVFRPLHVDAHRAGRPTRQGLLLLDLDLHLDISTWSSPSLEISPLRPPGSVTRPGC